jgi:hypothetical protein
MADTCASTVRSATTRCVAIARFEWPSATRASLGTVIQGGRPNGGGAGRLHDQPARPFGPRGLLQRRRWRRRRALRRAGRLISRLWAPHTGCRGPLDPGAKGVWCSRVPQARPSATHERTRSTLLSWRARRALGAHELQGATRVRSVDAQRRTATIDWTSHHTWVDQRATHPGSHRLSPGSRGRLDCRSCRRAVPPDVAADGGVRPPHAPNE